MKSKHDNLLALICVILVGGFSHPEYLETKYFCQRKLILQKIKQMFALFGLERIRSGNCQY